MQACCRGWQERRKLQTLRAAAVTIQKHWRSAKMQQAFKAHVACIVLVQSCVRRCDFDILPVELSCIC